MSLSSGLIAVVALAYMAIMFAIAFYGDRRSTPLPPKLRAWVYSLSLAVYCTSWTFFGAVGQAAEQLWAFLPIYLGPILLLILAPWVVQKMVLISKQENITSIADFIAARYGKSQALAVVVALICLVGVLPYIALQLKGIVLGVNLLIGASADATGTRVQDTALVVSLVLALFAIVFGTRSLDVTEHHRGMVLAIAAAHRCRRACGRGCTACRWRCTAPAGRSSARWARRPSSSGRSCQSTWGRYC